MSECTVAKISSIEERFNCYVHGLIRMAGVCGLESCTILHRFIYKLGYFRIEQSDFHTLFVLPLYSNFFSKPCLNLLQITVNNVITVQLVASGMCVMSRACT
jgi:hypothetical protein